MQGKNWILIGFIGLCYGVVWLIGPQPIKSFLSPLSLNQDQPTLSTELSLPLLTLNHVFGDHSWTATLSAERITKLIATGDVIPARSVNAFTLQHNDFTWAFKQIGPKLASGDITVTNLETPLIADCPTTHEGMSFCGDLRHIQGLAFAGVDLANLANNHAANHGSDGIAQTRYLLENNQIMTSGIEQPTYYQKNGLTWAFLGYDIIGPRHVEIAWAEPERMKRDIQEANTRADVVIVSMSWGIEYTRQPSAQQQELGHLIIDAGADLILGNHPHWVQPVELYKDKVIVYAHGNTIFDQMWSMETRYGVVGQYTFFDHRLIDIEFWPLRIDDYGQAVWLKGAEADQILETMQQASQLVAKQ